MILFTLGVVLVALAVVTLIGTRVIESRYPPSGRFITVAGGRMHVAELGRPGAAAVVLLHGASGNLGDITLALGARLAEDYRVIAIDRPGHGWSDRPDGAADASPGRQAELVHEALAQLGVARAILIGHSWSGALATAYALDYPRQTAGLVLIAPVTHPWPTDVSWINHVVAAPVIGALVARTLVLPFGYALLRPGVAAVFAPLTPPDAYIARAGAAMILRPSEFRANAQDIVTLKPFVTGQASRYGEIRTPVAIFASEDDNIVSTDIHARAIAAALPNAQLTVLKKGGHMLTYAVPDEIVRAVDAMAGR